MSKAPEYIPPATRGAIIRKILASVGISGRGLVIAAPAAWLTLFFLVPLAVVFGISFATKEFGQPPFSDLLTNEGGTVQLTLHLSNYLRVLTDPSGIYINAFLSSIRIAAISTFFAILIGYPMAYAIARSNPATRNVLLLLVILPFWTSFLLRVYAWIGILKNNGLINNALMSLGLIDQPIQMLQTDFAVYVGIVYSYLPFMILPLYANLEKMDLTLLEAAADLGCKPWQAFIKVTLPLSLPGIIAGCLLVFIPAVGEFVIPALLGDPSMLMIGKVLWTEFFNNRDWPVASAVAIALLLFLVIPIMFFQRAQDAESGGVHK